MHDPKVTRRRTTAGKGFVCDEGFPYDNLIPGDLWTLLTAAEVVQRFTTRSAVPLSMKGSGPPSLAVRDLVCDTVTRVRIIKTE